MRGGSAGTVVTERVHTSIPAEVRRVMDLRPGARLFRERVAPDELRVRVVRGSAGDPQAMLGFASRFRAVRTTEAWMAELREGER